MAAILRSFDPLTVNVQLMKRLLLFVALILCTGLASCQCANKPDVGPVEGEDDEQQSHVVTSPSHRA
jgi:hypothetical protein